MWIWNFQETNLLYLRDYLVQGNLRLRLIRFMQKDKGDMLKVYLLMQDNFWEKLTNRM